MVKEILQPTLEANEKLRHLADLPGRPFDSRVVTFAGFLADRMGNHEIYPIGFLMASTLAVYDLEHGVSGFTGEPLKTGLERQPDYVYGLINANLPDLAEAVFPNEFAMQVKEEASKIFRDMGVSEDDEMVTRPVTNIDEALMDIVEPARRKLKKIDWEHFGIEKDEEMDGLFDTFHPLILRNAGHNFPLNLLSTDVFDEAVILKAIPASNKRQLDDNGQFWLVITNGSITVEEATWIRDHVFLKSMELIIRNHNLNPQEVFSFFSENPSFIRSVARVQESLANRSY